MSQRVMMRYESAVAPYDPAESPGPYPEVVAQFGPGRHEEEPEPVDETERELARYAVLLVLPEHADKLGYHRADIGLKLYCDGAYDDAPATLYDAAQTIADECGVPVTLVEHRADLTYWTARRTPAE